LVEPQIITEDALVFLKKLGESGVPYLIIGMTSAILQGAPTGTKDIDIWFKSMDNPLLMSIIRECGGVYIPPAIVAMNAPMFGGTLTLFDPVSNPSGLKQFEDEYGKAETFDFDGIPITLLPLDRVIASKEASGRLKDKAVLPILRATLEIKQRQK